VQTGLFAFRDAARRHQQRGDYGEYQHRAFHIVPNH
jgi:hypothetical protein